MKQLCQKLKTGKVEVLEVPEPLLSKGMLLIRNHYSLISAGTEGSTVSTARKSLLGKARERPQQVKQVLDVLSQQGPVQTYRAVMKKLDSYSPMGYSSAGEILEVGEGVKGFRPGDRVACAGVGYANHAQIVAVPSNLCVPLAPDANMRFAAYNTLGAIAMQGVRQADLRLGETCVIIGLGLLGQLTGLLLKASGVRTIGIDINDHVVQLAGKHSTDAAFRRDAPGLESTLYELTDGIGADAVIITAGAPSTDPVNLAGTVLRKKGRVVVVGNVPTGFDRDPHYYRKELELRMSCSYGPGRYDLSYEKKGLDYPAGYVRWTENRNMRSFQKLLDGGTMDLDFLTTHQFKIDEAPAAYDIILERNEPYLGILIDHEADSPVKPSIAPRNAAGPAPVSIGFIGAGSYAMSHLLPNIGGPEVSLTGVLTASGANSKTVVDRYGFQFATADESDLLENEQVNTLFVATWHNSHAAYVTKALAQGKNVFVEKPLAITESELEQVIEAYEESRSMANPPRLMVGFNRRFSPLTTFALKHLPGGPSALHYRVNAGPIDPSSWVQDPDIGGGRVIGEVCHFIDYLSFAAQSRPLSVHAVEMRSAAETQDTLMVNVQFENGTIGSVAYLANGPKNLPKERIELFGGNAAAVIEDFKECTAYAGAGKERKRLLAQDKGQKTMLNAFLSSIVNGTPAPIPASQLFDTTRATFAILKSLRSAQEEQV